MNQKIIKAIRENIKHDAERILLLKSAILKDEKEFKKYFEKLQNLLTRAWTDAMRAAAKAGLNKLRKMDKDTFTAKDGDMILHEMEKKIGKEALERATKKELFDLTDTLYRTGHIEAAQPLKLDMRFNREDTQAIKLLQEHNLYWVGNSWDSYTKQKIDKALNEYFSKGMTRDQLATALGEEFANWTTDDKPTAYLTVLADHLATKTRELGRIPVYERARVEFLVVRARMDERTTSICRALNGKRIPLSNLTDQRDQFLKHVKDKDMEGVKRTWKMYREDKDAAEIAKLAAIPANDVLPRHIGSPPYHFFCRTETVVYFQ